VARTNTRSTDASGRRLGRSSGCAKDKWPNSSEADEAVGERRIDAASKCITVHQWMNGMAAMRRFHY